MGNSLEEMELDIKRFFEQIQNQNSNDKVQSLRNLIKKHIHINSSSFMLDHSHLREVISGAKLDMATKTLPVYLGESKRIVLQDEQSALFVMESFIRVLNKNDCFSKKPQFDYRENK